MTSLIKIYTENVKLGVSVLRRPKLNRKTELIRQEYGAGWASYQKYLDSSFNINDWLSIDNVDTKPFWHQVNGKLTFGEFNTAAHNRDLLKDLIKKHFPKVSSITEYGSGLGRNVLYLKKQFPEIDCFGYELCDEGVRVSNQAASKFNMDVRYSKMDFLNDPVSSHIFPNTDIAFTMFALEQVPEQIDKVIERILAHVKLGCIHIEPVPENYPLTFRGIAGRIDHWKLDYLKNFRTAIKKLKNVEVSYHRIQTAHNPLMFPSVYILKKA